MTDLVLHLVKPIVDHGDDVNVNVIEAEASVTLELTVNPADIEAVVGDNGRTIRSIRNILSAAAGRRKATLDLIDPNAPIAPAGESTDATESDDADAAAEEE